MNTYLYQIKDGFIMIDTGYENNYTKCTSSMKRKGISWADRVNTILCGNIYRKN
ncbi:hypothetical protein A8806_103104 [Faecalicatena orotica]|uniref:Uncharacterized protein n=1 Tax=Faecalicatena orotica TaxID=1544 RepID=A0A2Y9BAE4_9FIRM|nr:hypothetical protein A8806_103104 [Faecalicatena orotica]SSA54861.1 hypothetical protein SAMN05216536_103104 [Faecalicatena orotica]